MILGSGRVGAVLKTDYKRILLSAFISLSSFGPELSPKKCIRAVNIWHLGDLKERKLYSSEPGIQEMSKNIGPFPIQVGNTKVEGKTNLILA